jgi:hypothetical protein
MDGRRGERRVIVIHNVLDPMHLIALGALYTLTLSAVVHRLLRRY